MSKPKPVEKLKSKRGGARPGAGMPKGTITAPTKEKLAAKELLKARVMERFLPLIDATIDSAIGIKHFMLRDPETGTFKRLTDPEEIDAALAHPDAKEGSSFWIYVKDPQTPAAVTLLDRTTGKPIEEIQMEVTTNEPLAARMKQARDRVAKLKG